MHVQRNDDTPPAYCGENTRTLLSIAALARKGAALEKVEVITPPAIATDLTYLPLIEPADRIPADVLFSGNVPLLLTKPHTAVSASSARTAPSETCVRTT